jgi:type IV pilus assembly protein PilQ
LWGLLALAVALPAGCEFVRTDKITRHVRELLNQPARLEILAEAEEEQIAIFTQPTERVENTDGSVTCYYYAKYADPAELQKLLTQQVKGLTISINSRLNQMIIHDPNGKNIDRALDLLARLDIRTIQVRIDVLVVETFADLTEDYGIQWEWTGEGDGVSLTGDAELPGAAIRAPRRRHDMGIRFSIKADRILWAIDFLRSRGYAEDLARPSLLVSSKKKALIEAVHEIPIKQEVIKLSTTTLTYFFKPVKNSLQIVPTVYEGGRIGLKLDVSTGSADQPKGPDQTPVFTTRKVSIEECIVRQGQPLVVGGILSRRKMAIAREHPGLSDIPLLGILFRGKDYEVAKTEVVFIIIPRIVDSERPAATPKDLDADSTARPRRNPLE